MRFLLAGLVRVAGLGAERGPACRSAWDGMWGVWHALGTSARVTCGLFLCMRWGCVLAWWPARSAVPAGGRKTFSVGMSRRWHWSGWGVMVLLLWGPLGGWAATPPSLSLNLSSLALTGTFPAAQSTGTLGWASTNIVTTAPGGFISVAGTGAPLRNTGTVQQSLVVGSAGTLTLSMDSAWAWYVSGSNCTVQDGSGNAVSGAVARFDNTSAVLTLDGAATAADQSIVCNIELTPRPQFTVSANVFDYTSISRWWVLQAGPTYPNGLGNLGLGGVSSGTSYDYPAAYLTAPNAPVQVSGVTTPIVYAGDTFMFVRGSEGDDTGSLLGTFQTYRSLASVACLDSNAAYSGNPAGSFDIAITPLMGTFTVPAHQVLPGAMLKCTMQYRYNVWNLEVVNPPSLVVGQNANYLFKLAEQYPLAAAGMPANNTFVVYDRLPPQMNFVGAQPLTQTVDGLPSYTPSSVVCTPSGTVAAGLFLTCNVVMPPYPGSSTTSSNVYFNVTVSPQSASVSYNNAAAIDPWVAGNVHDPVTCVAAGDPAGCAMAGAMAVSSVLTLSVISQGGVGTFTWTGNNGWVSQALSTTTAGAAATGAPQALSPGSPTTLDMAASPSGFVISGVSCTGLGGGVASSTSTSLTLDALAMAAGSTPSCTVTLQKQPQLSVTVTLPGSATATFSLAPDAGRGNGWVTGTFNFTLGGSVSQTLGPQTLSAAGVPTRLNQQTPSPATYSMGSVSCTDANGAVSGNPLGAFSPSTPTAGAFEIVAANVLPGAQIHCIVAYVLSASAAQSTLTVAPAGPLVAGAGSYTVTAFARDANGALVTNSPYAFQFSSSGGTLSAANCVTVTSGPQAGSCSVTLSSTQAGWITVLSSTGGVPLGNSVQGQFVVPVAGSVAAVPTLGIWPGVCLVLGLGLLTGASGRLHRRADRWPT